MDNGGWYYLEIRRAKSKARLDQIQLDIDYDKWEGEPYTQDNVMMDRLRSAFVEQLSCRVTSSIDR